MARRLVKNRKKNAASRITKSQHQNLRQAALRRATGSTAVSFGNLATSVMLLANLPRT